MGSELRRMIRDGAPAAWTPLMRLVAMEIADDARDPDRDGVAALDLPWSAMPVKGHRDRRGRWRDGLTERCGMSERAVSRALTELARAGYEMREAAGTGNDGRVVFTAPGHAMRFRVPSLRPRPEPQRPPEMAADAGGRAAERPPILAERPPILVSTPAEFGGPVFSGPLTIPSDTHRSVVDGPLEGSGPSAGQDQIQPGATARVNCPLCQCDPAWRWPAQCRQPACPLAAARAGAPP